MLIAITLAELGWIAAPVASLFTALGAYLVTKRQEKTKQLGAEANVSTQTFQMASELNKMLNEQILKDNKERGKLQRGNHNLQTVVRELIFILEEYDIIDSRIDETVIKFDRIIKELTNGNGHSESPLPSE